MSTETSTVCRVAWEEVFPWLMIVRALRTATSVPALLLATVGVLLMPCGWWCAGWLLPDSEPTAVVPVLARYALPAAHPGAVEPELPPITLWRQGHQALYQPMLSAARSLVQPLPEMLHWNVTWRRFAYWTLGGLWNLVLWGLLGGTITRMAVMRHGREEREGLGAALRFVRKRWLAFFGAPLFALVGVALVVAFAIPIGWLLRWELSSIVAALVWPFVLLGSLLVTLIAIALVCGWPLMWGALSAEEMGDVYEGVQRMFAYVYGRPLTYAFYALLALVLGSLAYCVAEWLAQLVVYFGYWTVAWGAGAAHAAPQATGGTIASAAATTVGAVNNLTLSVAAAFRFSYLFTAAGVIYLLVRRDADQIELDVVYMPGQPTRFSLPPLSDDEAGVPGVDPEPDDA